MKKNNRERYLHMYVYTSTVHGLGFGDSRLRAWEVVEECDGLGF